jgi:hypothetical protein
LNQSRSAEAVFSGRQNFHSIVIVGMLHLSNFSQAFKKLTGTLVAFFPFTGIARRVMGGGHFTHAWALSATGEHEIRVGEERQRR